MHADFVAVGRAPAAPARSVMVSVLLDGQAHTAGELARAAGVASGTETLEPRRRGGRRCDADAAKIRRSAGYHRASGSSRNASSQGSVRRIGDGSPAAAIRSPR